MHLADVTPLLLICKHMFIYYHSKINSGALNVIYINSSRVRFRPWYNLSSIKFSLPVQVLGSTVMRSFSEHLPYDCDLWFWTQPWCSVSKSQAYWALRPILISKLTEFITGAAYRVQLWFRETQIQFYAMNSNTAYCTLNRYLFPNRK